MQENPHFGGQNAHLGPRGASRGLGGTEILFFVTPPDMLYTSVTGICRFIPILLTINIEKYEKWPFLAQLPPCSLPMGPPGVGVKFEKWLKLSRECPVVPPSRSFGV